MKNIIITINASMGIYKPIFQELMTEPNWLPQIVRLERKLKSNVHLESRALFTPLDLNKEYLNIYKRFCAVGMSQNQSMNYIATALDFWRENALNYFENCFMGKTFEIKIDCI